MTTLSSKLAALGVALLMNGLMLGSVAYLFSGQLHGHTAVMSLAQTAAPMATGAV